MRAENIDIPTIPLSLDSTPEELSEYDRKLLAAVVATNKELIIQSKRQSIQLRKVIIHGTHRLTEFATLGVASIAAVLLYGNLPPATKATIAENYLQEGIALITSVVAAKQMYSNSKDRKDLDEFERTQVSEISSIDKSYKE